jgi:ribosomal-protein-alanine N-acetyltransferase
MIREIEESELKQLENLEQICFTDDSWSLENFRAEFSMNPYAAIYVFTVDGEIAGYADLWIKYEKAEIANIAVLPEFRKSGIGAKLLQFCIERAEEEHCENMTLEVRQGNIPAEKLYEKYGFTYAGIRKHYCANGDNAAVMIKLLGGTTKYDSTLGN